MGLFQPAWMSRDSKKARAAVQKETRPDKLRDIVLRCPNEMVKQEAALKLKDQKLLLELVPLTYGLTQACVIRGIEDETMLRTLLLEKDDKLSYDGWLAALRRAGDDMFRAERILESKLAFHVKKSALGNIKDPSVLLHILERTSDTGLVSACLDQMRDSPKALSAAAGKINNTWVRVEALARIKDCEYLFAVACTDENESVRVAGSTRLRRLGLSREWWDSYDIHDDFPDLRMSVLARDASRGSMEAAKELTTHMRKTCLRYNQYGGSYLTWTIELAPYTACCSPAVIDCLEEQVRDGDTGAAVLLRALYTHERLNKELKPHAELQKPRFSQYHIDRQVDSDVCGEVSRHKDVMTGESIAPLA